MKSKIELDENNSIIIEQSDLAVHFRQIQPNDGRGITPWEFRYTNPSKGFVLPTESVVTDASGEEYLEYTFSFDMLDHLSATYHAGTAVSNHYFNIALGDITFAEGVTQPNSGRKLNGFWYDVQIPERCANFKDTETNRYFYEWKYSDGFRVTSNGVETGNQLTVFNTIKVYLKDCKFKSLGTKDDSFENSAALCNYANIILDTSVNKTASSYNVYLYIEGNDNVIPAITQYPFVPDKTQGCTLYVHGANGVSAVNSDKETLNGNANTLKLGTIAGCIRTDLKDLHVQEDTRSGKYLIYLSNNSGSGHSALTINRCYLDAPSKDLRNYLRSISFTDTYAHIGASSYSYGGFNLTSSNVNVENNVYLHYTHYNIGAGSRLIIGGYFDSPWNHSGGTAIVNGTVIAKGDRFEAANNLSMSNTGVIVANAVILGNHCTVNGKIVTNQLLNSVQSETSTSKATSNGDGTYDGGTLTTYAQNEADDTTLTFGSSSSVYLFGKIYSSSQKATDEGNGVADVIAHMEANSYALPDNLASRVQNYTGEAKECFILGSSAYNQSTNQKRKYSFSGNLYAAGNVTLYNDATISGGTF